MARRGHSTELYIEVTGLDANPGSGVRLGLQGTSAPGGDAGDQDAASIGSLFHRTDSGAIYKKIANGGSTADWSELGNVNLDEIAWRSELVRASTNDTVAAGSVDVTGFSDNEQGLDGNDFAIGEYLLGNVDGSPGSPALWEVTAVTGPTDITVAAASDPIAANDTFVVQNHLPDSPAAQEAQAILHSPDGASALIKIADFNWALADGINTTGSWAPQNGAPVAGETVEVVTEKIEKGVADLVTLSGVARNSTVLGAFSAPANLFLGASLTIKGALQALGNLHAQLRGVNATGITTITTVDEVVVDDVKACKWLVHAFEEATPANIRASEVYATHNGTASADATAADDSQYAKLKLGGNFNLGITVDVNGAAGSQTMRLRASSSTAGVTVTARRIEVLKNTL